MFIYSEGGNEQMEFIILLSWVLLPLLFFAIMAVVMGQILKLLGFKPANKLPDDSGGMWDDNIWTDPTYSGISGNLYNSDD